VLERELIPVQVAINSLATGGAQLEAGDVKAAAGSFRWGFEGLELLVSVSLGVVGQMGSWRPATSRPRSGGWG